MKRKRRNRPVKEILAKYDAGNYDVFSFRNGRRIGTYGNLDPLHAIEHVASQTLSGLEVIVFPANALSVMESIEYPIEFFRKKAKELQVKE